MGVALAAAAMSRGASVTLVSAHCEVPLPTGVNLIHVSSAQQMNDTMNAHADKNDIVIMAAAVADYRPVALSEQKLKKSSLGKNPSIELELNPDILRGLGHREHQYKLIGFAAETQSNHESLVALAEQKRSEKMCDVIVVNSVGPSTGFGDVDTTVHIVGTGGRIIDSATGSKASVANAILNAIS
jgi:phosphopantothenoylcysteine decarboxylase/phosphopantothenate--cysteine ligase